MSQGLKPHPHLFGNAGSPRHLVDDKQNQACQDMARDYSLEQAVFDHARYFVIGRGKTAVAMVTSPYERATLARFSKSPASANRFIHDTARQFGLSVRVGHPFDAMYLSPHDDDPTLPIVWWNHSRFDLPYAPLVDPNSQYRDRMER